MAETVITDLREIDIEKIKPSGFVVKHVIDTVMNQIKELKVIIDELLDIKDKVDLIPRLQQRINSFNTTLLNHIKEVEEEYSGNSNDITQKKDQIATAINSFYDKCLNPQNSGYLRLLETYAIAKSFIKTKNDASEHLRNELIEKIEAIAKITTQLKNDSNIDAIKRNKAQSETILNELKKKTSEQTVSDYAVVFGTQAGIHKTRANTWITIGTIISILFIIGIILMAESNLLQTEIYNEAGTFIRYDFTNLVTKILLIAVVIFLMSFSFKQYSVNRHLQTLNTQRQKALNSYKLFMASISKDDINSRNALMIQVAKAIYEPQSTGFLNEKGQQVNSGLVEITKLISQNGA